MLRSRPDSDARLHYRSGAKVRRTPASSRSNRRHTMRAADLVHRRPHDGESSRSSTDDIASFFFIKQLAKHAVRHRARGRQARASGGAAGVQRKQYWRRKRTRPQRGRLASALSRRYHPPTRRRRSLRTRRPRSGWVDGGCAYCEGKGLISPGAIVSLIAVDRQQSGKPQQGVDALGDAPRDTAPHT